MAERVLFVGISDNLSDDISDALERLGHSCVFFNQRSGITFRYSLVRKALRALPALKPLQNMDVNNMNRQLLTAADEFQPTILLVWNGERIHPETVHTIRSKGATTVNWFLDFMTHWPSIKRIAPLYDYFFSPDRKVIEALGAEGIPAHHASFGCRAVFDQYPENTRPFTVSFIGSYGSDSWTKREEFLSTIADSGLHIWGPPRWQQSGLNKFYRGVSHGKDMMTKYSLSKIVIDVPWDHVDADAVSIRPFEATAAGACLFFYNIRPEMQRMYEEGLEFVSFTNADELKIKLAHYLSDPELLQSIARAGYKRFMRDHTYVNRLRGILSIVRNNTESNSLPIFSSVR